MIEKLQLQRLNSPNSPVAVLFAFSSFNRGDTSVDILLLLVQQATILQPQTPKAVEMLYERHIERHSVPTLEEVEVAFRESLRVFSETYILIDGLDELADQLEPFLDVLGSLITTFKNLKILVTSRPAPSLTRHSAFHERHISIERHGAYTEELRLFIRSELNSRQLRPLLANDDLRLAAEEYILNEGVSK